MLKQTNFWNEQLSKHKEIASELKITLEARAQDLQAYESKFAEEKQKLDKQAEIKAELDRQLIEQK